MRSHTESVLLRFCLFWISHMTQSQYGTGMKSVGTELIAEVPGDIMLGGLFPVHTSGATMCNAINPERGIQRVEAMLFTIDEINNKTELLPGIRLGATIRDTCSATNFGLEQALQFVQGGSKCDNVQWGQQQQQQQRKTSSPSDTVVTRGVVGSSYSSVTILVANLFRLFSIPQISYASTSAVLSDKRAFPLFARTVPSDVVQARAMANLVSAHNWTYVSTVRSAGDYGDSGMDAFWKEADKLGVCIAAREVIRPNYGTDELDAIVHVLRHDFAKARVVVLFTGMDHTKLLLDAVRRAGLNDHFVWIASDGWGRENLPVSNNSRVANGALTIEIQSKPVAAFTDHYLNLGYDNPRNPWFKEYWEDLFGCTFGNSKSIPQPVSDKGKPAAVKIPCSRDPKLRLRDKIGADFKQEAKIQFVYDAVYAFASGLHMLQRQLCVGNPHSPSWDKYGCIAKLLNYSGVDFYKLMIKANFTPTHGNMVAFDDNGDGNGQYSIYNYARDPYTGHYDYRLVGDYQSGKLTMRARPIWPGGQSSRLPVSQCSEECGFAEIRRLDKKQQCCWSCETCAADQRVVNLTHCETCAFQHWPSANRTTCELLELHYIDLSTWFGIVPMTFSSVGIVLTIGIIVTWLVYSETPVVRATGRELAYVQLAGCLVSYACPFVLLATPSVFTCSLQRILIGLGFAMMYASLLTKTNRIARIFDAAKRTTRRPVYISPRSQLVIAGSLITLQLALSAIWFGFDPPDTRIDPIRPGYLVLRCAMKDKSFLISLAYNMILIVVCTAHAIKTRHIPENFNESKFIGFAMYTTCIIWLAFLPMFYATMNNHEIQITTLCISISLSASVMLSCLFLPKLYIIYIHPEKNVRRLTMNNPKAKTRLKELGLKTADASDLNRRTDSSGHITVASGSHLTAQSPNSHTRVSATLTMTSSTRTDEVVESGGALDSVINTDVDMTKPRGFQPANDQKPRNAFVNVISNPLLVPDGLDSAGSKTNPITSKLKPSITNTMAPATGTVSRSIGGQVKASNNSDFPTPTPLLLDTIPKRLMLSPTYCDETTSIEEDGVDEDDSVTIGVPMSYQCEASSCSQIVLPHLYHNTPYSPTDSLCSGGTAHSSDLYIQSYGDDTQILPSITSNSLSVASGSVFSQRRQPPKTISRIDYSKQTVTAL